MKLTKAQIEYAGSRIRTLINEKFQEELSKLAKPAEVLSNSEKWDLVLAGKARLLLRDGSKKHQNYLCLENFDFPKDKKKMAAIEKYNVAELALRSKYKALEVEAMDKLMLAGDADAALALVESLK